MLTEIMSGMEPRQKQRENSSLVQAEMRGTTKVFDPHVLDVTKMVKKSCDRIFKETIARCWLKSRVDTRVSP